MEWRNYSSGSAIVTLVAMHNASLVAIAKANIHAAIMNFAYQGSLVQLWPNPSYRGLLLLPFSSVLLLHKAGLG